MPHRPPLRPVRHWRPVWRALTGAVFVLAGANHFIDAPFYREIIPPSFPAPALLVAISGVCEIAGGVGLFIRPLRRAAGWGLVALLIAVFPANLYMAEHHEQMRFAYWLLLLRLPMQGVLIYWVWHVSRDTDRRKS